MTRFPRCMPAFERAGQVECRLRGSTLGQELSETLAAPGVPKASREGDGPTARGLERREEGVELLQADYFPEHGRLDAGRTLWCLLATMPAAPVRLTAA